jgi:hypothetical protein
VQGTAAVSSSEAKFRGFWGTVRKSRPQYGRRRSERMEKVVDAFIKLACLLVFSAGGNFAAKKTFRYVQKAALEKSLI